MFVCLRVQIISPSFFSLTILHVVCGRHSPALFVEFCIPVNMHSHTFLFSYFKKVLAINVIPRYLAGSQSQASPSVLLYQLILHY